jgi:hypothetical protein
MTLNNNDPVLMLTSLKANERSEVIISCSDDIDILLQYIDQEQYYELEITDVFMGENFVNLMELLEDKNNHYCCCEQKEFLQKQTICKNRGCKKPLSNIKKLICSCYYCPPIMSMENCVVPEMLVRWNRLRNSRTINGFDNLIEFEIFFVGFPKEIVLDLSKMKQVKKLRLKNCFLSIETINSLEYLNQLEEIIIEESFSNVENNLVEFFEILKKRKTKLKILRLR